MASMGEEGAAAAYEMGRMRRTRGNWLFGTREAEWWKRQSEVEAEADDGWGCGGVNMEEGKGGGKGLLGKEELSSLHYQLNLLVCYR